MGEMKFELPQSAHMVVLRGSNGDILELTEGGFKYQGEVIQDAGEAHDLFVDFLQRALSYDDEVVRLKQELESLDSLAKGSIARVQELERELADLKLHIRSRFAPLIYGSGLSVSRISVRVAVESVLGDKL